MSEWTAVRRVGLCRVGEGVSAESINVLAAARRKVFGVRFVDGTAPNLSLPQHLLPVHRVPEQHAVGQQRQAPGRFDLSLRRLAPSLPNQGQARRTPSWQVFCAAPGPEATAAWARAHGLPLTGIALANQATPSALCLLRPDGYAGLVVPSL